MDRENLNTLFKETVKTAGGPTAFSRLSGIDVRNVSAMIHGKIPVQGQALDFMGLKRIMAETFIPISAKPIFLTGWSHFDKSRIPGRPKPKKSKKSPGTKKV